MREQTRRDFVKSAGALAASAGISWLLRPSLLTAGGAGIAKRPNVLFFFPDQHRGDWLGTNPAIPLRTPNLNRIAGRGVRFTNALSPSPLCAPCRACLAAGKEYDRCGVASNGIDYPINQVTFYTLLRDSGYHVAGCGKFDLHKASSNWGLDGKHLLPEWGFSDGIDNAGKMDAVRSGAKEPKDPYMAYLQKRGLLETHVEDFRKRRDYSATFPTPLPEEAYCDNWVANNGLELMKKFPQDKPWFLQINFTGPHNPMDITKRMESHCRGRAFPQPNRCTRFSPEIHVAIRQNYSAMVENVDRWLGIYIGKLKERGELDNTIIVWSSDHGEMLGDHDAWGKSSPYQPSVGVPLLAAGPGIRGGFVCDAPVSVMDLAATFLDYGDVRRPDDVDSRSLKPLLEGKKDGHREYVLAGLNPWRVAFDGRYKLVRGFRGGKNKRNTDQKERGKMSFLLFDLKNDPLENVNIADQAKGQVERLSQMIGVHLPKSGEGSRREG
jgi:arylsulfatase A-like enzyme